MRVKKRITASAAVVHLSSLYTVAEVVHAIRGEAWHRLEDHLDRVDVRADAALADCRESGDGAFAAWLDSTALDWTDVVCAVTTRLAREPVR